MKKNWQRRTIGILTLGGSGAGFAVVLDQLFNAQLGTATLIILVAALLVYVIGIAAGVQILENSDSLQLLALPFWLIQIPVISSPWISYALYSGARFNISITGDADINFLWAAGSRFSFFLLEGAPVSLGVNVVAIMVCYVIMKSGGNPSVNAID